MAFQTTYGGDYSQPSEKQDTHRQTYAAATLNGCTGGRNLSQITRGNSEEINEYGAQAQTHESYSGGGRGEGRFTRDANHVTPWTLQNSGNYDRTTPANNGMATVHLEIPGQCRGRGPRDNKSEFDHQQTHPSTFQNSGGTQTEGSENLIRLFSQLPSKVKTSTSESTADMDLIQFDSSPPPPRLCADPVQNSHPLTTHPQECSESAGSHHDATQAPFKNSDQTFRKSSMPISFPMLEKEEVIINLDLHKKLQERRFIAPFYWKPKTQQDEHSQHKQKRQPLTRGQCIPNPTELGWGWRDSSFVKLPFSKFNQWNSDELKWNVIMKTLVKLRSLSIEWIGNDQNTEENMMCHDMHSDFSKWRDWFGGAVCRYNGNARFVSNFKVIKEDDILNRSLLYALPFIIDHALKLPARLEKPIPILKRQQNQTLCLTRNLACSLLANAFLCTFPEQDWSDLPYFNFFKLFDSSGDPVKTGVKREKIKCILEYFHQMSEESGLHPNSIITFERRCYPMQHNWANSPDKFCDLEIKSEEKVEEAKGMLQVDFANRVVGGGVLNDGAVQEEIRFCISPELICARLFTESLNHDEVLVITGTAQFSSYSGYSSSFKHVKLENFDSDREFDNLGRQYTQVVAMDAYHFKPFETDMQYKPGKIDRELHKCVVAFTQGKHSTVVATGNWGCGAFNGDPELKFLIQWMAASVNKRKGMLFHARGNDQEQCLKKMRQLLISKNVTVGKLYKILMKYESKCIGFGRSYPSSERRGVFNFVEKCVNERMSFVL